MSNKDSLFNMIQEHTHFGKGKVVHQSTAGNVFSRNCASF